MDQKLKNIHAVAGKVQNAAKGAADSVAGAAQGAKEAVFLRIYPLLY